MTDNEPKEVYLFKFIPKSGEEMSSVVDFNGEGTVFYSNGDKFTGCFVNGVIS